MATPSRLAASFRGRLPAAAGAAGQAFDTEAYDKQRLELDEQARNTMIRKARAV
jgi:hypothetical protein